MKSLVLVKTKRSWEDENEEDRENRWGREQRELARRSNMCRLQPLEISVPMCIAPKSARRKQFRHLSQVVMERARLEAESPELAGDTGDKEKTASPNPEAERRVLSACKQLRRVNKYVDRMVAQRLQAGALHKSRALSSLLLSSAVQSSADSKDAKPPHPYRFSEEYSQAVDYGSGLYVPVPDGEKIPGREWDLFADSRSGSCGSGRGRDALDDILGAGSDGGSSESEEDLAKVGAGSPPPVTASASKEGQVDGEPTKTNLDEQTCKRAGEKQDQKGGARGSSRRAIEKRKARALLFAEVRDSIEELVTIDIPLKEICSLTAFGNLKLNGTIIHGFAPSATAVLKPLLDRR